MNLAFTIKVALVNVKRSEDLMKNKRNRLCIILIETMVYLLTVRSALKKTEEMRSHAK